MLFITFEGGEGSGKSTQARKLVNYLTNKGYNVIFTREPGGPEISEQIRDILLNPLNAKMSIRTELFLYMASRAQHVEEFIKPALEEGKIVICDRFIDSSIAYQAGARGISDEFVSILNNFATNNLIPDITFLMDIEPEIGIKRIKLRQSKIDLGYIDRIEREKMEFHQSVRKKYLEIYEKNRERVVLISANQDENTIWEEIKKIIDKKMEEL